MHNSMGYKLLKTIQIKTHNKTKVYEKILILEKKTWLNQSKSLIKLRVDLISHQVKIIYLTI